MTRRTALLLLDLTIFVVMLAIVIELVIAAAVIL